MLTWLICHDADTEKANSMPIWHLSRHLEDQKLGTRPGAELAEADSVPRVLKTHLPDRFFTSTFEKSHPKVIVVMRNPKDVITSYYYMHKKIDFMGPFKGSFDQFFDLFKAKELQFGDMFEYNLSWWRHRGNGHYLFLRYEDMKRDVKAAIGKIADLCNVTLTRDQVNTIAEYCQFETMRESKPVKRSLGQFNVPVGNFMRKGIVGDWKNELSQDQSEYIDKLCGELYKPVGIDFSYD